MAPCLYTQERIACPQHGYPISEARYATVEEWQADNPGEELDEARHFCPWCQSPDHCDCQDRRWCTRAGFPLHRLCGNCPDHNEPRFVCGCRAPAR